MVYKGKVGNREETLNMILQSFASLTPQEITRANLDVDRRVFACRNAGGAHFQQYPH